jgi:hypothetical protein
VEFLLASPSGSASVSGSVLRLVSVILSAELGRSLPVTLWVSRFRSWELQWDRVLPLAPGYSQGQ